MTGILESIYSEQQKTNALLEQLLANGGATPVAPAQVSQGLPPHFPERSETQPNAEVYTPPVAELPQAPAQELPQAPQAPQTESKLATRNTWLEMNDGSCVFVPEGSEMPEEDAIARRSTKKAYDTYVAAQKIANNAPQAPAAPQEPVNTPVTNPAPANNQTGGGLKYPDGEVPTAPAVDWGAPAAPQEPAEDPKTSYETFVELMKSFGANGHDVRVQQLTTALSSTQEPGIVQFKENKDGRLAIIAQLEANWPDFNATLASILG